MLVSVLPLVAKADAQGCTNLPLVRVVKASSGSKL